MVYRLCLIQVLLTVWLPSIACAQSQYSNGIVGGTPVQIAGGGEIAEGEATTGFFQYRVPTGKRLIIEFVSLLGAVPDDQKLSAVIATSLGASTVSHQFYTTAYPTNPSFRTDSVLTQSVRLYADADTDVVFWGARAGGSSGRGFLNVAIIGTLVEVTASPAAPRASVSYRPPS
jgi:hypothetical protein